MKIRGAKFSVENLRGVKNFHHFPKSTPTGYPDLKKTGPLLKTKTKTRAFTITHAWQSPTHIITWVAYLRKNVFNQMKQLTRNSIIYTIYKNLPGCIHSCSPFPVILPSPFSPSDLWPSFFYWFLLILFIPPDNRVVYFNGD